jgi:hypothetical protein
MRVGSYRIRLARILNASLPEWRGRPIVWAADRIYPAWGIWRHVRMDVMRWEAAAHFADKPGCCALMAGCWETIGECIKAGRVALSDQWTIYPVPKEQAMAEAAQQLELPIVPRERVRLTDDELPIACTAWQHESDPPMVGWWEVRDRATQIEEDNRWWWDGNGRWHIQKRIGAKMRNLVMHSADFNANCEWRGLRQPSPDVVYTCPPYASGDLILRAKEANVTLRTSHAVYVQPTRERVKL